MNDIKKNEAIIGRNFKQIRIMHDLSQEEVGRVLGVTFQQIQKYETGQNRISAGKLSVLAKTLGIDVKEFFEEGDETNVNSLNMLRIDCRVVKALDKLPAAEKKDLKSYIFTRALASSQQNHKRGN